MTADIAQPRPAQDRIGHGVQQHIRVRMAGQAPLIRNAHAANDEGTAFDQDVQVVALADAERKERGHGGGLQSNAVQRPGGARRAASRSSNQSKSSGQVSLSLARAPRTSNGAGAEAAPSSTAEASSVTRGSPAH